VGGLAFFPDGNLLAAFYEQKIVDELQFPSGHVINQLDIEGIHGHPFTGYPDRVAIDESAETAHN
jgi:hypothetical protein